MHLLMTCPTSSEPIPMPICSVLHLYICIKVSSTCIWHGIIHTTVVSWHTFHVKCEVFPQLRAFSSHCKAVTWPTRPTRGCEDSIRCYPVHTECNTGQTRTRSKLEGKMEKFSLWHEGKCLSENFETWIFKKLKFHQVIVLGTIDWPYRHSRDHLNLAMSFPSCYRLNFLFRALFLRAIDWTFQCLSEISAQCAFFLRAIDWTFQCLSEIQPTRHFSFVL